MSGPPARFVLLRHTCPPQSDRPSHWDLMLENGDHLRTWALERLPAGWDSGGDRTTVAARQLNDHRREYLEYEGPLRHNRGSVSRVAQGTYNLLQETPLSLTVHLVSNRFRGKLILQRDAADSCHWRLIWDSERNSDGDSAAASAG